MVKSFLEFFALKAMPSQLNAARTLRSSAVYAFVQNSPNGSLMRAAGPGMVGQSRLDLTARPLLAQDDRATAIVADDVKRVLADIDADQVVGHEEACNERDRLTPLFGTP